MNKSTKSKIIKIMQAQGCKHYSEGKEVESLHFWLPVTAKDLESVQAMNRPHHLRLQLHERGVHLMAHNDGYYCTSDLTVIVRYYRSRNEYTTTKGNIFAHGGDPVKCIEKWLENYAELKYNVRR